VSILYRPRPVGRNRITSVALWAVAIAALVVLAGCGGGSSSSSGGEGQATAGGGESTSAGSAASGKAAGGKGESTSGKTVQPGSLSKSEFVKQANAICEKGKKEGLAKMSAYVKAHKGSSEAANLKLISEAIRTVFIPQIQNQVDAIRALGAPAGEEAQVEGFLTALEEDAEAARQSSGTSATLGKSFRVSVKLAHEYGVDGCAYG
jgi:hypothetical protein